MSWFFNFFTSRPTSDRRRYPRTKTSNLVKFFDPRVNSEVQVYNMVDLSAGGLRLRCSERFRVSQSLNLLVNLPEKNQQIAVLGRVVWSAVSPRDPRNYRIGVRFSAIGEDDRMKIHDYVRRSKKRLRFALLIPIAGILFRV